jgi:asparagine synthase (glutamine-hydrolysing)
MCGIAGWAGRPGDPDVLVAMGAALAHRGPDDTGMLAGRHHGFAFRRLSIIDVAGGNQPIANEDSSLAIVLNGELYNYRTLREGLLGRGHRLRTRGDVETVVHLYEEEGPDCLRQLRGMYALAIWDERDRSLFLARDRAGKKPLYYCLLPDGCLVFGSEIKAILQHPDVPRTPDLAAIDHFLTLQYVPSPLTAFSGIRRLPPAHWLRWRDGRVEIRRYWELAFGPKRAEPEPELREELLHRLREAVELRLESEVPLGAFLSGGIDSSAVVALAAGASTRRLRTFSIGFASARFDETPYARLVADRFETDHHELRLDGDGATEVLDDIVWHYDQPFGDSSAVPSFHVARLTRPHVTVVLNGDGGDESFAGYSRYRLRHAAALRLPAVARLGLRAAAWAGGRAWPRARRAAELLRDAHPVYYASLVHLPAGRKPWLYRQDGPLRPGDGPTPPLEHLQLRRQADLLDSMLDADVNHYLPDDLLVKMDVATMAHSLEARSPFLDHELMEFAARLPSNLKLGRGGPGVPAKSRWWGADFVGWGGKVLLKSALRGLLPDEVLDRPKMGFSIPLAEWLRTDLRDLLQDTVASERALARGLFRPAAVRELVDAHLGGDDSHKFVLWDLLMLELWMRRFIDARPAPGPPVEATSWR